MVVESKTVKSYALHLARRVYSSFCSFRSHIPVLQHPKSVFTLKYVVLLGLFGVYIHICLPFAFIYIPARFGLGWGLVSMTVFFIPITVLVLKEVWRQLHLKPMHDGVEISTEAQMKALEDYLKLLQTEE